MLNHISHQCYDSRNKSIEHDDWYLYLDSTPYRFSDVHNKFTVIGCDTLAYIGSVQKNNNYWSGCVSMCNDELSLVNGSCSGIGCCQTSIPKGLTYYTVSFDPSFNSSGVFNFSRCSYAVLLEANGFNFSSSYITTTEFMDMNNRRAPLVVDWAIGNETCEAAIQNRTSYACISANSACLNSTNGPGYLCKCSSGYQGNPYVHDGCQDIDECADKDLYPCHGTCNNTVGSYECWCPPGTHGNPSFNGTCTRNQKLPLAVKTYNIFTFLVFLFSTKMLSLKNTISAQEGRNYKMTYLLEHGGWLLLEEIKGKQGLAFKIFTIQELEQATNRFDNNRVLGRGGYGTVYKGSLEDNHIVAVKKPKMINESNKNEFGKEMFILSQINHKNIVKLLGCCLEVEVPMLVYEFVPNGTLFHLIHEHANTSPIPLGTRLRIAYESADALAYLHSSASPPIIHGDVKSSNILLDENYMAKVSDFGASKLVPKDEDQFATLVQGTCGYLDPEYLQTCQLTDKSDVYSFGVVLLELLTGKKALYFEGSEEERSLASNFLSAMKENRLLEMLDDQVKSEGGMGLIQ
ncbi:unnamed protein product [Musa acuminata subsp. malaccensis]|uniref:(wild Malaysian banana) hypothetical protein n=1 Tax=Musa acuminata subsp. malaccensis TaxID=214687 RepID=A0A8D7F0S2_MUSAM|nr:unnamed protein product [Musa acuminata subsp. malaccensis]